MVLIHVWAVLVALAMILYIILDGISLGVGLLFPSARDEKERSILMNSIGPVWDANQTWIVFGGGAIFVAFPVVYGVLSSAPRIYFVWAFPLLGLFASFQLIRDLKSRPLFTASAFSYPDTWASSPLFTLMPSRRR